jgi:hypothetical protein
MSGTNSRITWSKLTAIKIQTLCNHHVAEVQSERKSPSQNKKRTEIGRYTVYVHTTTNFTCARPSVPLLPHSSASPSTRNRPHRTRIDRGSWDRGSGQTRACTWERQVHATSAYSDTTLGRRSDELVVSDGPGAGAQAGLD